MGRCTLGNGLAAAGGEARLDEIARQLTTGKETIALGVYRVRSRTRERGALGLFAASQIVALEGIES